jgi:hypothetical protein
MVQGKARTTKGPKVHEEIPKSKPTWYFLSFVVKFLRAYWPARRGEINNLPADFLEESLFSSR